MFRMYLSAGKVLGLYGVKMSNLGFSQQAGRQAESPQWCLTLLIHIQDKELAFYFIYLFIYLLIYLFIYLFLAVLGLRFCARALSSCGKRGPLFTAVRGPLPLRSTGSRRAGSATVAHGPSRSAARGIFPDQGSNPCPLHWQADPQSLRHQGSPELAF